LDVGEVRRALGLLEGGVAPREVERQMGLKEGVLAMLSERGIVGVLGTQGKT
jgi:hypothetical protein